MRNRYDFYSKRQADSLYSFSNSIYADSFDDALTLAKVQSIGGHELCESFMLEFYDETVGKTTSTSVFPRQDFSATVWKDKRSNNE